MKVSESRQGKIALAFAEKIAAGDFGSAHRMLAAALGKRTSPAQLQAEYETMIEYGDGPPNFVGVMNILDEWPAKQKEDVGWAYVAITGDGYSEAVVVVVSREQELFVIREIEWGRP